MPVKSRSYDLPTQYIPLTISYIPIIGNAPGNKTESQIMKIKKGLYRGVTIPGYYRKKAQGKLLPLTPYVRFDLEETRNPGTYWGTYRNPTTGPVSKSYKYVSNPTRAVNGAISSFEEATQIAAEMTKGYDYTPLLQSALADLQPDLDVLTSSAELGKTLKMVAGVRKNAVTLMKQALRGNFQTAKAAGNAWLQWRYGWRILGFEVQAVQEALAYPIRNLIVEGRAWEKIPDDVQRFTVTDYNYYVTYDRSCYLRREMQVGALAQAKLSTRTVNAFASIPNTMWELIPFSFVADWFVSIGNVLKAWEVLSQVSEITMSTGMYLREHATMTVTNPRLGNGAYATSPFGTSGQSTCVTELRSRTPRGVPSLKPQINVKLTSARILDLAALLINTPSTLKRR